MKRLSITTISLLFLLAGCTDYARREDIKMGMTVDEVAVRTPCFFRGGSGISLKYSCQLDVPSGQYLERRSIIPYILTFEDGRLKKIELDEAERQREAIMYRYYYDYPGYGYYWYGNHGYIYQHHGYGHHYLGH